MSVVKYSRTSKINIGDFAISKVMEYLHQKESKTPITSYDILFEDFDVEKHIAKVTHETPFYKVKKRAKFESWLVLQVKKLLFVTKDKKRIASQIKGAERVIIGGGNLFSDRAGGDLFYRSVQIAKMAKQQGIPVGIYAVGMGPFMFSYKSDLKRLIKSSAWFSVRDNLSKAYCDSFKEAITSKVQIILDPAFVISDMYPGNPIAKTHIGLNFMNFAKIVPNATFNLDKVVANLISLHEHYRLPFKIINTSFGEDLSLATAIAAKLTQQNIPIVIVNISSLDKLPEAFLDLKFFIASRMHSSIFAMSYNVPTLIYPWHAKVTGLNELLFKDNSKHVLLNTQNVAPNEIIAKIEDYTNHINLETVIKELKATIYSDYARFIK